MTTEAPPPPIVAHAMQLYGPYFTDLSTEAKVTSAIEALGTAHPAEREFTALHLQYLTLMQLGRNERIHSIALGELQRIRALLEHQAPMTEDMHEAVVDLAEALTSPAPAEAPGPGAPPFDGEGAPFPPEGPDQAMPGDALPEGVTVWTGHDVETIDPNEDPETPAQAPLVRARPMVDDDAPHPTE